MQNSIFLPVVSRRQEMFPFWEGVIMTHTCGQLFMRFVQNEPGFTDSPFLIVLPQQVQYSNRLTECYFQTFPFGKTTFVTS